MNSAANTLQRPAKVSLGHRIKRSQFSPDARTDFYLQISTLLETGLSIMVALRKIYDVHSDEGRRPDNIMAVVAADCIKSINRGRPMSEALAKWVSRDEVSVLAAGETAGKKFLLESFQRCVDAMVRRQRLLDAALDNLMLPAGLLVGQWALMLFTSFVYAPMLLRLAPLEKWVGPTRVLLDVSDIFGKTWWMLLIALMALFWYVSWSLSNTLRVGPVGRFIQRLPPWNMYGIFQGSTFIDNLVAMLGSGTKIDEAVRTIRKSASPWLAVRADGVIDGIRGGLNLGAALKKAGHAFPDRASVAFLQAIDDAEGFDTALDNFARRWLETNIRNIGKASFLLRVLVMLATALVVVWFAFGSFGISQMADVIAGGK